MLDRHWPTKRCLTATLTGALLFVSAPTAAQNHHGVITFGETDQSNGVAYGFAWNFPEKDAAHAEAANACIAGGGTNCIQLVWFHNGCGALAMDQHGNAQGKSAMTREQAEERALQGCEAAFGAGCNIVGSLCTAPDGEPGTYSGSESVLPVHEEQEAQTTVTETDDESLQDAQTTVAGPDDEGLAREDRVLIQQALNALGFDAGPADGIFGPRTRSAIFEWQSASGHAATGYVTREQAAALAAVVTSADQEQQPRQEAADKQPGNVLIFDPLTTQGNCTDEEAMDAIWEYLGPASSYLDPTESWKGKVPPYNIGYEWEENFWHIDAYYYDPRHVHCTGVIRVVNDCILLNVKGLPLKDDVFRQLSCEPVN